MIKKQLRHRKIINYQKENIIKKPLVIGKGLGKTTPPMSNITALYFSEAQSNEDKWTHFL